MEPLSDDETIMIEDAETPADWLECYALNDVLRVAICHNHNRGAINLSREGVETLGRTCQRWLATWPRKEPQP